MDILFLQALFLFSIFSATLFPYLIPTLLFSNRSVSQRRPCLDAVLLIGNCLSCGVFVGVCFLGLIPFSLEKMESALIELQVETHFPFTEAMIVMGFLLTLLLEECAKLLQDKGKALPGTYYKEEHLDGEDREKLIDNDEIPMTEVTNRGHSHSIEPHVDHSNFRFFLLTFATSTHSFFEGLAVGLQTDNDKATKIFIGMILHESLMAFALGMRLASLQKTRCQNLKYILVFCIAIPAGMIVGIVIGQTPGTTTTIINAVLQSIAAGTFIHVTFMELIPEVFRDPKYGLLKILFIFNGFLVVTVLCFAFD